MSASGSTGPISSGRSGRTYRVCHTTEYQYSDDVSSSYGRAHLMPRPAPGQVVLSSTVDVEPGADELRSHADFYGNVSTYYSVRSPHRQLRVTATSEVHVDRVAPSRAELDQGSWEHARDGEHDLVAVAFGLSSPLVRPTTAVTEYAEQTFAPGRPLGTALAELLERVHTDFAYTSGATTVRTTLGELLHKRKGVCQDFAHLVVGCLRAMGLPARYVSGYLETEPPPGQPKLQGADASHAWASVHVPRLGWVDLDPTNDQLVDARYVVSAWGRDYTDVPPLKGVIITDARKSEMTVAVDVVRIG